MSFPVQVIVASDGEATLSRKSREVCDRLGVYDGGQVVWRTVVDDQPDLRDRVSLQVGQLVRAQGARGEGGFGRLIVAGSLGELASVATELGPEIKPVGCRFAVAVALCEVGGAIPRGFDAVHIIPENLLELGGRMLERSHRVQIAANVLSMVVDIARQDRGSEIIERWLKTTDGNRVSLLQVARLNGEALQEQLAEEFAGDVSRAMRHTMDTEWELTEVPATPTMSQGVRSIETQARLNGAELFRQIMATDADGDEEFVARSRAADGGRSSHAENFEARVQRVVSSVPSVLQSLVEGFGVQSIELAVTHAAELRELVDRQLRSGGFAAVPSLLAELERGRHALEGQLQAEAADRLAAERVAGFTAPDHRLIAGFDADRRRHEASREPSGYLLGAWSCAAACIAGGLAHPLAQAALGGRAQLESWLGYVPGGPYTIAGALFMVAVAFVLLADRFIDRRNANALESAFQKARTDCQDGWENELAAETRRVGRALIQRQHRHVLQVYKREIERLETIHVTIMDLSKRFEEKRRGQTVGPDAFDRNIEFVDAFREHARQIAQTIDVFRDYDEAMRRPEWRMSLEFMAEHGLLDRARLQFAHFRERIPFDVHEKLRETVLPSVTAALVDMESRMGRYVPAGGRGARFLAMPDILGASARDLPSHYQRFGTTSDVFVGVSWRLAE